MKPPSLDVGSSHTISQMWEFMPKPGSGPAFEEAIKAHVEYRKSQGDPWTWDVYHQVVGPTMSIAGFGDNWADFADTDPNMEQVMMETYGEEEAMEIFYAFGEAVNHWESFIVRHRPDLSGAGGR
jgi:hypothetical protein